MTRHYLAPLLAPRSVAFVGASRTEGSVGNKALREMLRGGFPGRVYPINPRYDEVEGLRCHASLRDLPEAVDLAVLMVGPERPEAMFGEAVSAGAGSALIFDAAYLQGADPPLHERLGAIARRAGIPVCGSNCTGFVNLESRTRGFPWPPRHDLMPGHVTLISHSGSTFGGLLRAERRLSFNLAVSPGHELGATVADYVDYALEMQSTRVIGLIIETARDPKNFAIALDKAQRRGVPIVAVKVGRSALSAELARSHSGAIAGNDVAYRAVFDRYGVHQADDIDELVATLQLFAQPRRVGRGGLAVIGDSGGERELLVDVAASTGVPFARISEQTTATLASHLHPSLRPVNPLDAYAGPRDFSAIFGACFDALLADPDTALGLIASNVLSGFPASESYIDICRRLTTRQDKPIAVASLFAGTEHGDYAVRMGELGVPVIYGAVPALKAVRHLFAHRDATWRRPSDPLGAAQLARLDRWRPRLAGGDPLDEAQALSLLGEIGIAVQPFRVASDLSGLLAAAAALGYPVVLKTAEPGLAHKTEVGGVVLGLADQAALRVAYAEMSDRLGPRVLVAAMAGRGVEMALGTIHDPQFGPLVMVAAGGTSIALFRDAQYALAPVDRPAARAMIDRLAVRPLLDGHRGAAGADLDGLADAIAQLSGLAAAFGPAISEIDVNPLLVSPEGAVALDALVLLPAASRRSGGDGNG